MFDADMRYLALSVRWREDYCLGGDVISKSHYELFPDVPERWKQVHRRALAGETLLSENDFFDPRSGSVQCARCKVRPWRRHHGGIGGIIISIEEVADIVPAHQAPGQSEARLSIALAAASAGVWERDLRTSRNYWSDKLWKLYGLTPNGVEPSHEAWRQSVHPDDRERVTRTVNDAIDKGAYVCVEWRVADTGGAERWLMSCGGPLPDANGDVSRYGGLVIDITERKKSEEAVRDSERRLKAVFDASMDAIVVIDSLGTILSVNPELRTQFGYANDEVVGRNLKLLMPADKAADHDKHLAAYLRGGDSGIIGRRRRVQGRRKDGTIFWVELAVMETKVAGEQLFIGFMHDLTPIETERRKAEAAQAELLHVARLSDMGEVTAGLAHEVCQPLTAILGFASTTLRTLPAGTDSNIARGLAVIEAQAQVAADILKRFRAFIEKHEVQRTPENLTGLIQDALALASLRPGGRLMRTTLKPLPNGVEVQVDRVQVQQVLLNLLRNAMDAMEGQADPEIVIETAMAKPGFVLVNVSDNGSGIDPRVATRLFTPFVTTKTLGMGVGLSLCKSIVLSHGGEISCVANKPRGAVFSFTLPVAAACDPEPPTTRKRR